MVKRSEREIEHRKIVLQELLDIEGALDRPSFDVIEQLPEDMELSLYYAEASNPCWKAEF